VRAPRRFACWRYVLRVALQRFGSRNILELVEKKWFGFEEDKSPGVVAWYPLDAIRSAVSDDEAVTVFIEVGSVYVACGKPGQVLRMLLSGSLAGILKKGSHGVTSVSLKREEG
jgi:hypothetical protein